MTTILERYRALHPRSAELHKQAARSFPDGVTHDIRHFAPFPIYVDHALGARKWDVDGNEMIDYVIGHGALLLGHAHPTLVRAVTRQIQKGTHYGASTELEMEWAGWIRKLVPSAQKVRFHSSGTEATMMAVRLARAYTGRNKLVRFALNFHGWNDSVVGYVLPEETLPRSPGIPPAYLGEQIVLPQNDVRALAIALSDDKDVAAVIVEPTGASASTVPIDLEFLAFMRERTAREGVLLIFDEVVTGFRVGPGGAQERFGIMPDLTTLGKIIGGGLPVGAFGGRRDVMETVAPLGATYQAGTLSGNPLAMAAGAATLRALSEPGVYERLEVLAQAVATGLAAAAATAGRPCTLNRVGPMMTLFFCEGPVRSFAEAKQADTGRFAAYWRHMLESGIYLAPSQFEATMVSLALNGDDIARAAAAAAAFFAG
jgi:glutamate-1-semialdehyde 2,1-aminomutase